MDQLPQEVYDKIVYHFFSSNRLPEHLFVSTISRKFQLAVERLTFRSLCICGNDDLNHLAHIVTPNRRSYITRLCLRIVIPPFHLSKTGDSNSLDANLATSSRFETDATRGEASRVAAEVIRKLFHIVASWCRDQDVCPSLELEIHNIEDTYPFGESAKCNYSMLTLEESVCNLPSLPCIRRLKIGSTQDARIFLPSSVLYLVSRLPNVESIQWDTSLIVDWGRYFVLDQIYRDALAKRLHYSHPYPPVKDWALLLKSSDTRESDRLPNFTSPLNYDPVACGLRHLTKECTTLQYRGPVHPSLFDPPPGAPSYRSQCWQNLGSLQVLAQKSSPDGYWYFNLNDEANDKLANEPETAITQQLPPGYGANEQELIAAEAFYSDNHRPRDPTAEELAHNGEPHEREMPNTARVNALMRSFATAVAQMPAIREATLRLRSSIYLLDVTILAPGEYRMFDEEYAGPGGTDRWRVYMSFAPHRRSSLPDWRPADEVLDLLKVAKRDRLGREPVLCFLPAGRYAGIIKPLH